MRVLSEFFKDIMVGPQFQATIPPLNTHLYQERGNGLALYSLYILQILLCCLYYATYHTVVMRAIFCFSFAAVNQILNNWWNVFTSLAICPPALNFLSQPSLCPQPMRMRTSCCGPRGCCQLQLWRTSYCRPRGKGAKRERQRPPHQGTLSRTMSR